MVSNLSKCDKKITTNSVTYLHNLQSAAAGTVDILFTKNNVTNNISIIKDCNNRKYSNCIPDHTKPDEILDATMNKIYRQNNDHSNTITEKYKHLKQLNPGWESCSVSRPVQCNFQVPEKKYNFHNMSQTKRYSDINLTTQLTHSKPEPKLRSCLKTNHFQTFARESKHHYSESSKVNEDGHLHNKNNLGEIVYPKTELHRDQYQVTHWKSKAKEDSVRFVPTIKIFKCKSKCKNEKMGETSYKIINKLQSYAKESRSHTAIDKNNNDNQTATRSKSTSDLNFPYMNQSHELPNGKIKERNMKTCSISTKRVIEQSNFEYSENNTAKLKRSLSTRRSESLRSVDALGTRSVIQISNTLHGKKLKSGEHSISIPNNAKITKISTMSKIHGHEVRCPTKHNLLQGKTKTVACYRNHNIGHVLKKCYYVLQHKIFVAKSRKFSERKNKRTKNLKVKYTYPGKPGYVSVAEQRITNSKYENKEQKLKNNDKEYNNDCAEHLLIVSHEHRNPDNKLKNKRCHGTSMFSSTKSNGNINCIKPKPRIYKEDVFNNTFDEKSHCIEKCSTKQSSINKHCESDQTPFGKKCFTVSRCQIERSTNERRNHGDCKDCTVTRDCPYCNHYIQVNKHSRINHGQRKSFSCRCYDFLKNSAEKKDYNMYHKSKPRPCNNAVIYNENPHYVGERLKYQDTKQQDCLCQKMMSKQPTQQCENCRERYRHPDMCNSDKPAVVKKCRCILGFSVKKSENEKQRKHSCGDCFCSTNHHTNNQLIRTEQNKKYEKCTQVNPMGACHCNKCLAQTQTSKIYSYRCNKCLKQTPINPMDSYRCKKCLNQTQINPIGACRCNQYLKQTQINQMDVCHCNKCLKHTQNNPINVAPRNKWLKQRQIKTVNAAPRNTYLKKTAINPPETPRNNKTMKKTQISSLNTCRCMKNLKHTPIKTPNTCRCKSDVLGVVKCVSKCVNTLGSIIQPKKNKHKQSSLSQTEKQNFSNINKKPINQENYTPDNKNKIKTNNKSQAKNERLPAPKKAKSKMTKTREQPKCKEAQYAEPQYVGDFKENRTRSNDSTKKKSILNKCCTIVKHKKKSECTVCLKVPCCKHQNCDHLIINCDNKSCHSCDGIIDSRNKRAKSAPRRHKEKQTQSINPKLENRPAKRCFTIPKCKKKEQLNEEQSFCNDSKTCNLNNKNLGKQICQCEHLNLCHRCYGKLKISLTPSKYCNMCHKSELSKKERLDKKCRKSPFCGEPQNKKHKHNFCNNCTVLPCLPYYKNWNYHDQITSEKLQTQECEPNSFCRRCHGSLEYSATESYNTNTCSQTEPGKKVVFSNEVIKQSENKKRNHDHANVSTLYAHCQWFQRQNLEILKNKGSNQNDHKPMCPNHSSLKIHTTEIKERNFEPKHCKGDVFCKREIKLPYFEKCDMVAGKKSSNKQVIYEKPNNDYVSNCAVCPENTCHESLKLEHHSVNKKEHTKCSYRKSRGVFGFFCTETKECYTYLEAKARPCKSVDFCNKCMTKSPEDITCNLGRGDSDNLHQRRSQKVFVGSDSPGNFPPTGPAPADTELKISHASITPMPEKNTDNLTPSLQDESKPAAICGRRRLCSFWKRSSQSAACGKTHTGNVYKSFLCAFFIFRLLF